MSSRFVHEQGDVAKAFAEADYVVEREFNTRTVHQGYIEPQNASALWNTDGHLTVWTSTQGAFVARDALAGVLEMPVSQIKVVPMEIGGGFGGKIPNLPGAGGCPAVKEDRPAGEDADEPHRDL